MESQTESGLGNLLRTERENKGLSLERVAEITRLRMHFLEALENEEWEKLPARVFVKGFIRSYAQSVGFDPEEAIRLYDKIVPVEEIVPKPLVGSEKGRKKAKYIIPIIVIMGILAVLILFSWKRYMPEKSVSLPVKNEPEKEDSVPVQETTKESGIEEITEDIESEIVHEETEIEAENSPALNEVDKIEAEETAFSDSVKDVIPNTTNYSLTGIVKMTTYVKIYVDDNPPQEWMFRPGKRPQWTAEKGFDILVGNAAGIEFIFNGELITDIGGIGKVKRLNFPKDFKSELYEN